ncbi:hypothetical protein ACFFX0_09555 [Citricoccus parietis]|uniref:Uncharacterized protein n=1 Tax=Citricoccus parietis TaxID=592307 RepID=A0ABV5FXN0_9MICC
MFGRSSPGWLRSPESAHPMECAVHRYGRSGPSGPSTRIRASLPPQSRRTGMSRVSPDSWSRPFRPISIAGRRQSHAGNRTRVRGPAPFSATVPGAAPAVGPAASSCSAALPQRIDSRWEHRDSSVGCRRGALPPPSGAPALSTCASTMPTLCTTRRPGGRLAHRPSVPHPIAPPSHAVGQSCPHLTTTQKPVECAASAYHRVNLTHTAIPCCGRHLQQKRVGGNLADS